jgi:hypothetical protein
VVTSYALKYAPGTDLGTRFPTFVLNTFRTFEAAEAVRRQCASASQMEVVETPNTPIQSGQTAKLGVQKNGPGIAEFAPPAGALTTNKESPNG